MGRASWTFPGSFFSPTPVTGRLHHRRCWRQYIVTGPCDRRCRVGITDRWLLLLARCTVDITPPRGPACPPRSPARASGRPAGVFCCPRSGLCQAGVSDRGILQHVWARLAFLADARRARGARGTRGCFDSSPRPRIEGSGVTMTPSSFRRTGGPSTSALVPSRWRRPGSRPRFGAPRPRVLHPLLGRPRSSTTCRTGCCTSSSLPSLPASFSFSAAVRHWQPDSRFRSVAGDGRRPLHLVWWYQAGRHYRRGLMAEGTVALPPDPWSPQGTTSLVRVSPRRSSSTMFTTWRRGLGCAGDPGEHRFGRCLTSSHKRKRPRWPVPPRIEGPAAACRSRFD